MLYYKGISDYMKTKHKYFGIWLRAVSFFIGLFALIWFLIRVIPKPSRASYPCQRVAFPIASSFVLWVTCVITASFFYKSARSYFKRSMLIKAFIFLFMAILTTIIVLMNTPDNPVLADGTDINQPIGSAKGIYPGRVVWVYDPNATDWDGYESKEPWYDPKHTDMQVVELMMSQAFRSIAGQCSEEQAWDAIFKYYNQSHGKGRVGYQSGEKIAIKVNLTTCNAHYLQVDPVTYDKKSRYMNLIDNSPQLILSLLRQLVNKAGVEPASITVGDPTGMIPNYYWNILHPEFPDVKYLDNLGGSGRTRAEFSDVPIYWSTADADGKITDYIPVSFAQADYIINFAILKTHSAGITLCAKNHYGSLLRCPDGYLRDEGYLDYYNLHNSLPNASWSPGMGNYRSLVDIMGHQELGDKTLLYMIDGLFGGFNWDSHPYKWLMEPFGDDWPSSLFVSLDPVAIDSVGYDFLLKEWPDAVADPGLQGGAEDYLHEAALANMPASGTFYDPDNDGNALNSLGVHEHWNNSIDKQYSRNLGNVEGIELIKLPSQSKADFNLDNKINFRDFANFALSWQKTTSDDTYNNLFDIAEPNGIIDARDLANLTEDWLN